MKRFWPFRSFANFTLSTIGVVGVGLFYMSITNEGVFSSSTVVSESIKQLGINDTLRNLIGNPISYSGAFSNTYKLLPSEQYYNFEIKGSKSKTTVQLNATKIQVKQINNKIHKVKELKKQLAAKQQEKQQFLKSLQKLKKQQKQNALLQLQILTKQTTKLLQDLNLAERDKILTMKKYYIPGEKLQKKIIKDKDYTAIVPDDQYLFGIDGLVANLPNRSRITIFPNEQTNIDSNPQISNTDKQRFNIDAITQGYIRERQREGLGNVSEEELQSYSKHKTMGLYSKYGSYRVGFMLLAGMSMVMLAVYWHMNRILPLAGTLIAHQAQQIFVNHAKTRQIMKAMKKTKKDIKFGSIYLGGRKGEEFTCQVDVEGIPEAKVYFQGKVQQKQNIIKFNKVNMHYRDGSEIKKIDLLV